MEQAVIVAARRTAIGNLGGALSGLPAHALGQTVIGALLAGTDVSGSDVQQVILGQVLTAGQGMNPARQAARGAGIADEATAFGINQVCGSGLRAVMLGAQQIMLGEADIVVAGGQESMSQAPHVAHLRPGKKLGDLTLVDTVMRDGLSDAFYGYAMGVTAENVARKYGINRQAQDEFAVTSQMRAAAAQLELHVHGFARRHAGTDDLFVAGDRFLELLLDLRLAHRRREHPRTDHVHVVGVVPAALEQLVQHVRAVATDDRAQRVVVPHAERDQVEPLRDQAVRLRPQR